jgi:PAS domain S-box-containing protein
LRWHLAALVAALALPLIALAVGSVWREHRGERARAEDALRHQAQAIAQALDREFRTAEAALIAVSHSSALAGGDLDAFAMEARATATQLDGDIILVEADGRFALSTAWAAGGNGPDLPRAQFATRTFTSGQPEVSDLFRGLVTDRPIVVVAVPVFGQGSDGQRRVVRALTHAVAPERITDLLHEQGPKNIPGAFVVVKDRQGAVVARTGPDDEVPGRTAHPELARRLASEEDGIVHGVASFAGKTAVVAFAYAPWSRYAVILNVPEATFRAPFQEALLRISAIGGFLLAMGLLAARLLSLRIISALCSLAQVPVRGPRVTGLREVDDLARTMTRTLAERNAALARLRSIVETAADGVVVANAKGRIVSVNRAALWMFGYGTEQDLLGRDISVLMPPAEAGHHRSCVASARIGALPRVMGMPERDLTARRADGSEFPIDVAVGSFEVDRERFFTAFLRDVTTRKAADAALVESERRLSELLATLDLGAAMACDLDGTITFWSQGCARLYGWSAREAVGKVSHDLLRMVFPASPAETEATLLREGEWSGDLVQRTRDGQEITVAARKVLRRDDQGRPIAVMKSVADVTALRRAQAELASLNRDLETRVREEVAAREAAQLRAAHAERMQALGQLAGGIAHDFNNVLQAVTTASMMIERRASDAEGVRRLSRMAADAAGRGSAITRRLLAFARRGDLRAEALDAAVVLEGLHEILAHTLGTTITVNVEAEPDLPPLLADRGQLETVLVNLCTNARDAMPGGGTLTLSASLEAAAAGVVHAVGLAAGRYIRLAVSDTGAGMGAATLARVTEPFFTTKPPGQGTGLGLAMARGFAEQSGGALRVESAPGEGTRVTLWLPQAAETDTAPAARRDVASATGGGGPRGDSRRVLLVDDDPLVLELLAGQLDAAGFSVVVAASGAEALGLLAAGERIDVLVTDLAMPGMDGLALIREAQKCMPGLPAVLLTGYAGEGVALAVGGAVNGPFALLRKPVSGPELTDRLEALLAVRAAS